MKSNSLYLPPPLHNKNCSAPDIGVKGLITQQCRMKIWKLNDKTFFHKEQGYFNTISRDKAGKGEYTKVHFGQFKFGFLVKSQEVLTLEPIFTF